MHQILYEFDDFRMREKRRKKRKKEGPLMQEDVKFGLNLRFSWMREGKRGRGRKRARRGGAPLGVRGGQICYEFEGMLLGRPRSKEGIRGRGCKMVKFE